ncbi:hypothetical protein SFA35_19235 [Pseudomonas sp. HR96]|uniref:fimbrial protein n=1 Tax=Pseudomonas sp. HR96 TaxID=1027966 RepID=UPI002A757277|nr:hypothetical protein [Pseudomonas sp. HR96]WPO98741.1 hypothetical protein SFA35_19235 [Pseudomonas sp. HR96]
MSITKSSMTLSAVLGLLAAMASPDAQAIPIGVCDIVRTNAQSYFLPSYGMYSHLGWTRLDFRLTCPSSIPFLDTAKILPQAHWAHYPGYCVGSPYGYGFRMRYDVDCRHATSPEIPGSQGWFAGGVRNFSVHFDWYDAAGPGPGRHTPQPGVSPYTIGIQYWLAGRYHHQYASAMGGWGEQTISSCSLTSRNVPVDFGRSAAPGDERPFSIIYGSCTDQADAERYNDAISLRFTSAQINPDGSLNNSNCGDCASGVRIAIQDSNGTPIPLTANYKLNTNPGRLIDAGGVRYEFLAQLQDKPGESKKAGRIDTQLVFETIME